jgi:cellulose synthase/poly-beta-1,6-N-acetylglucosamine synthase-like glycosyltransferase
MYFIEVFLLTYFAYISFYSFFLSLAGLFYRVKNAPESDIKRKVAVLIPAYKEDGVIINVASQALQQNYPADRFDVVVIADSLKPATLEQLRSLPIKVVEVVFEKSTKVKALNKAMDTIGDSYDCALVLDADNIMEPDFIRKMNNLFNLGYRAIQGKRDAKNENTSMALLDGISETINNFIYRQGTVSINMSCSLSGSGMIFEYGMYKKIMSKMDSIGGFDRELELILIENGIDVYYANNVIVYDEKVETPEVFERQRKRWISSQFFYLRKYFGKGFKRLIAKGDLTFFNSAILRNIQLPRLLNLGLLTFFTLLSFILGDRLTVTPWIWMLLLMSNVLAMAFAIPRRLYNVKLLKSVLLIPGIFFKMLLLLFKLKGANKTFIHTPHGHVGSQSSDTKKV